MVFDRYAESMYPGGMGKSQRIELTSEQRERLEQLIRAGAAPARKLARARILLLSDSKPGGWQSAPAVAKAVLVHPNTVRNGRRRFMSEGLEAALDERGQRVFRFSRRGTDFDPSLYGDPTN